MMYPFISPVAHNYGDKICVYFIYGQTICFLHQLPKTNKSPNYAKATSTNITLYGYLVSFDSIKISIG